MTDNPQPITAETIAQVMEVPVGRVNYNLRSGIWNRFILDTQPYAVDPALLDKKVWWAIVLGTNDSKRWPSGWTGPRMSRKEERRALRKAAIASGNAEIITPAETPTRRIPARERWNTTTN